NEILPELFEKTADYTELLLTISFTDGDGIVSHLVNDIAEEDFTEAVEIIGWLYQYYNTEPKDEVFALLKKNFKITKERIPAATQLFTPDWIVRYMVENSLGRLWLERERAKSEVSDEYLNGSYFGWKYYLEEAEQEESVKAELEKIRAEYKKLNPEDIKIIDPCMGSGHILAYAFDVLMQIYESQGYTQRDAAVAIIENNLYGLDIDDRAYQLSYFAVMMKARKYDRRFFTRGITPNLYSIEESNTVKRQHLKYFGAGLSELEHNNALNQMNYLLDTFKDAKEYGSILKVNDCNWKLLRQFISETKQKGQITIDTFGIEETKEKLLRLIDIGETMAQKYDVVVTNPPYMGTRGISGRLVDCINENYPNSKADIFSVFIERGLTLTKSDRYCSMVTPESWMFITSFDKLRNVILSNYTIVSINHLGYYGFEVGFGTAAFVIIKSTLINHIGTYIDLNGNEKDLDIAFAKNNRVFVSQSNFHKLPGNPIAYWADNDLINTFKNKRIADFGRTRQGMATSDNNRFLRFWYEVNINNIAFESEEANSCSAKWFPYNKGGGFRKWYGTAAYVINWENDGKKIKEYAASLYGSYTRTIKNIDEYFKEAIAWPYISSGDRFGARYQPKGFIFDVAGSSLFTTEEYKYYLCGLLSSRLAIEFMRVINPTMNYQVGDIAKIPVVYDANKSNGINCLVKENISIAKDDWDSFETSWDFIRHPLAGTKSTLFEAFADWKDTCNNRFRIVKTNEEELNQNFNEIYKMQNRLPHNVDDALITLYRPNYQMDIKSLISYAVGCMLGRYSLDAEGLAYAGGDWDDSKYETFIPNKDNCLLITDEEYLSDDIVGRFVEFVKCVYGTETLEENLDFIAEALGNKGNTSREIIRNYFVKDFYKDHVKTYKKRPIYWLYDSGRQDGFKALIYMHRYHADTTGLVRVDYLHKMQRVYESEVDRMKDLAENSKNAREVARAEKRREKLVKQLKETKEYDEKIAHLAPRRIEIDLDDGVKVNYEKVQTDTTGKIYHVLAKI
ncbi:MAG: BREX-1 system adenine-specific DNA-methyltransferase PglX, partial [Clostridia bacterium]|nr:BREX-1 system adenine-specific DNA-methyltransferase PglX [Clostridia bacterium]